MVDALALSTHHELPTHQKSAIRSFYERNISGRGMGGLTKGHVIAGGHAIKQSAESLLGGGVLGAIHVHAKNGLDLADGKAPLDGIVWLVGMLGGVWLTHDGVGDDLRNFGASGLSVLSFRKTFEYMAEKRIASGGVVGGKLGPKGGTVKAHGEGDAGDDVGAEDHITRIARELGL